ncbi:MAG: Asp-tRNA(Asn)/Glu-tRNA(Gln) amidotransferase subunit GatC [Patescibacteria group bacterium]
MSLTQEQIEKLSQKLTKLKTQDPKLGEDVSNILDYIDLLNEVDTSGVHPTVSVVNQNSVLRKDEVSKEKISTKKELLGCTKQKVVADQIAVQNIMK